VVHSRDDRRVPAAEARGLAAAIPDSRLLMLPSGNHLLTPDEPAWPIFLSEVETFLAT
jgi:pimeloyl-ACP methyl ester carboxylesterase